MLNFYMKEKSKFWAEKQRQFDSTVDSVGTIHLTQSLRTKKKLNSPFFLAKLKYVTALKPTVVPNKLAKIPKSVHILQV